VRVRSTAVAFSVLLVAMVPTACSRATSQAGVTPSPAATLAGSAWVLSQLSGNAISGARPTLLFAPEELRVSGFAGCNQFGASYELASDGLRFGRIIATRMFCEGQMTLEAGYLEALAATNGYRIDGATLELLSDRAGVIATFERK
jgi:heat shock protein HslJ